MLGSTVADPSALTTGLLCHAWPVVYKYACRCSNTSGRWEVWTMLKQKSMYNADLRPLHNRKPEDGRLMMRVPGMRT